ncbi:Clp protease N-terminal domain-containing protein [Planobispora siamensis]|uniref:Clp R domain-containing protein n=1 Tax=Planobispora siamensis TaxID=936338 RepID=A0A8J3WNQ2_9ACTN|nr:Clp protease N-terminal domain-containing protein [Planobispora siamensis]GIH96273.1 hypothetical protein Psi01_69030 [Planobispora siamensis]
MLRGLIRHRKVLHGSLERLLTNRAREALEAAEREARTRGDDRPTSQHLLAALARDDNVAVAVLTRLGVDAGGARIRAPGADLHGIVAQARHQAAGLGHGYIGTEHLLLALVHEEGPEALGIGLDQTRVQVIEVLHGH